jgi:transposase-like protein
MNTRNLRIYDKEFKLNAIKLFLESGRSYPKVSKELGIPFGTLATWVKEYKNTGEAAFPGKGHLKPSESEVNNLRKELAIVREERDI